MTMTPLPAAPNRASSPDVFDADVDAFLSALPDFVTEANALEAAVDADKTAAAASATAAATSATSAATSATNAATSATAAASSASAASTSAAAAASSATGAAASETNAAASAAAAASSPVASPTHAATSKATPVDADELPLVDSAASNGLKKLTWANLKAGLKAYFDSLTTALSNKTLLASGLNTVEATSGPGGTPFSLRNRVINGGMVIDQRNAGSTVTFNGASSVQYTVDRFFGQQSARTAGVFTLGQSSASPAGFAKSLLWTQTTAETTVAAGTVNAVGHVIEGYNIADLNWGTASAQPVTLSFWVKSSISGTFGGSVSNGSNRSYPFTYAINSANTWEQKTVTIPGDTSGTWNSTNGGGLTLYLNLGSGSTYTGTPGAWAGSIYVSATGALNSVATTLNSTWQITGVQLEAGSYATPFERRPHGLELGLCQRYYHVLGGDGQFQGFGLGQAYSTTQVNGIVVPFPVPMRALPTFSYSSVSDFYLQNGSGSGVAVATLTQASGEYGKCAAYLKGTVASGLTAGNASSFFAANTSARLKFDSEL